MTFDVCDSDCTGVPGRVPHAARTALLSAADAGINRLPYRSGLDELRLGAWRCA